MSSKPLLAVKDEGPEGSVPRSKRKTGGPRPQEDAELMPQSEVLGRHFGPRAKEVRIPAMVSGDSGRR